MLKQVIVVRKDLNMRKGKMVAQGCHASIGALYEADTPAITSWEMSGCTKVVVGCDSEQELGKLFNAACEAGLPCYLVTDAGRTEFNGVPTKTAMAIGPANADAIDKITGELKLL